MRLSRTRHSLIVVATVAILLTAEAMAQKPADPFDTAAITPPAPRLELTDTTFTPCKSLSVDAVYSVLDVVDQALCRNPKIV